VEDDKYIILNREYKPLGFKTMAHVKYEDYPIAIKFKRFTIETIKKISYKGSPEKDWIYLYNDGCIPTSNNANMEKYLKRLGLLARLRLEE
jgi:hypothetical protein